MASWKKVLVSGSNINVASLQVDNLPANQILVGGGSGSNISTIQTTGTGNVVLATGSTVNISGSFSGSFIGNGSQLSGVTATAVFPTTNVTNLNSNDKFFISQSTGQEYVTYQNLVTDLAGTNLAVEGNDSLTLSSTITGITSINSTAFTGSLLGTSSYASTSLSASQANNANTATSASYASSVNNITNAITNNADNRVITATGTGTINGEANLTFDGTTLSLTGNQTISNNLTVNGDIIVAGTASFINTDNLSIKDKFILINSGSTTLADSGIVSQYNAAGSGSALYLEANSAGTYGRFAVAYDIIGGSTLISPDEFVTTAKINQSGLPTNPPTWGGNTNGMGNIWINNDGDIYIYT